MKIRDYLAQLVTTSLKKIEVELPEEIHLEHPADTNHGDYATNVAMVIFKQQDFYKNPRELAQAIVDNCVDEQALLDKIEIAGPGFINFTLSEHFLISEMASLVKNRADHTEKENKGKTAVIEYMQPNTNKPLHIGHLRNAILGKAVINLLEETGWKVAKATINNDRGLHIIKSMWGYLVSQESGEWQELLEKWRTQPELWPQPADMDDPKLHKPDFFVGHWYVQADAKAEDSAVQQAWKEMLQSWEDETAHYHQLIRALWKQMNDWFYQGYEQSGQKIGFEFDSDHVSYESKIYEAGRQIILEAVEKGLFTRLENGAVQAKLEKFGLPDKVLLRGDGTGIYMTFDIELTRQRSQLHADKLVWVVGNDQALYFRQLFAISEMLGFGNKDTFFHFSYGMVRLPEGKMSSRKGIVVYADDIVDLAQEKAAEIIAEKGMLTNLPEEEVMKVAETVGLGAVKWSMLSVDPLSTIKFDIDESVSFSGFAGPYLQYTYARCQSILEKAISLDSAKPFDVVNSIENTNELGEKLQLSNVEKDLLRNLYIYSEIVEKAAQEFAPHHITTYLFNLAQALNSFYGTHKVLDSGEEEIVTQFRLQLVLATSLVIERGLKLLGIAVVSKM